MDSIMPSDGGYDLATLLLGAILAVMIQLVIYFRLNLQVQRAAAGVPALGDDNAILTCSSGVDSQAGGGELMSSIGVEEGEWNRKAKQKVTYEPQDISVNGVKGKTTRIDLHWERDCTRSGGNATLQLSLNQIDFGTVTSCTQKCKRSCSLQNRSCESTRNQIFINKMTVEARPRAWAKGCHRLQMTPDTTQKVFQVQYMSTLGVQLPVGGPQHPLVTWQGSRAICRQDPNFEWSPACKGPSNEVTWTWNFSRYADGTRLIFERFWLRFAPVLGIQTSCIQFQPDLSATYELLPNVDVKDPEPAFDIKIIVHPALLKPHFPTGYSLIEGEPHTLDSRQLTFSNVSDIPQTGCPSQLN